jgi:hypothetical protein
MVAYNANGTNYGVDMVFSNTSSILRVCAHHAGYIYYLDCKVNLSDVDWTTVSTVFGNGAIQVLADPNATGPQRFYRVRVVPNPVLTETAGGGPFGRARHVSLSCNASTWYNSGLVKFAKQRKWPDCIDWFTV